MPIVDITLFEGRTPEQKKALHKAVSSAIETSIGAPPASIRIILREIPKTHLSVGGETKD